MGEGQRWGVWVRMTVKRGGGEGEVECENKEGIGTIRSWRWNMRGVERERGRGRWWVCI